MIRKVIYNATEKIELHLPENMVGKTIQIVAVEVKENQVSNSERLLQIEELTKKTAVDLSNFKFDRDGANDYK